MQEIIMYFIRFLLVIFLSFISYTVCYSAISGGVEKNGDSGNRVVDSKSKAAVKGAKIKIPQLKYSASTDQNGRFYLDAQINGNSIMSVEKEGYRPFSLTLNEGLLSKPLVLGIEKTSPRDVILETDLLHIGDDVYSDCSANSSEFKAKSVGYYITKNFSITPPKGKESAYLVIGTVIGIDTLLAQQLGQSHAVNAYASAPEVFFNGQKIAEIKCNGDGQKIKLPPSLIHTNRQNEITIRCGKNLFQHSYIDYDDIELMNLFIAVE